MMRLRDGTCLMKFTLPGNHTASCWMTRKVAVSDDLLSIDSRQTASRASTVLALMHLSSELVLLTSAETRRCVDCRGARDVANVTISVGRMAVRATQLINHLLVKASSTTDGAAHADRRVASKVAERRHTGRSSASRCSAARVCSATLGLGGVGRRWDRV